VTVYGAVEERERVGTVAFRVAGVEPAAAALRLGAAGVCVGNGHFYATMGNEALQLMPHGVLRASIAHYTSLEDVARLLQGIREMLA
jgi:selenocysteine lyase/cysteine desulfurase